MCKEKSRFVEVNMLDNRRQFMPNQQPTDKQTKAVSSGPSNRLQSPVLTYTSAVLRQSSPVDLS